MKLSTLLAALAATSAMTVAPAQTGTDSCTTPDAIAGQGTFAFDSTLASTGLEGQTEALCYAFGSSAIEDDVWFSWTADVTGIAIIGTCTSAVDTRLAAYPAGGCPAIGTALDCNDDTCALQSTISFAVVSGTAYTLQVGSFPGAGGGTGAMDISIGVAGPEDDCAAPLVIAGQGTFPYDNSGATTGLEGQTETLCYDFGSSAIENDMWFSWTSDATGNAVISTCNNTATDTRIAAYPGGGCPTVGSALACNDDSCALQSQASFPAVNGTSYMIQVGNFPGTTGGTSAISISIGGTPSGSDDCSAPDVIAGQGTFNYDSSTATTGTEGQNETLCYDFGTSAVGNDLWFSWTADVTGPATVSTCTGANFDTKIAAYPGSGCPTTGTALACNDDTCGLASEILFPAVAGSTYMLQLGTFPGTGGGAASFDIFIQGPPEPGTGYCYCDAGNSPCGNGGVAGNGCANGSNANGANLTGSGVASVGADSLVLSASGLAPNQPGLYFQGDNQVNGGAGIVFGDGIRCAGTNVIRLGVAVSDAAGDSDTTGLGVLISVKGGVLIGDNRSYQLWYRDPVGSPCGALFNLTNGYNVQW